MLDHIKNKDIMKALKIQSEQNKIDKRRQNWINYLRRMTDKRILITYSTVKTKRTWTQRKILEKMEWVWEIRTGFSNYAMLWIEVELSSEGRGEEGQEYSLEQEALQ
jgi:hypothetical protein